MTTSTANTHNRGTRLEKLVNLTELVNAQSRHGLESVLKAATQQVRSFFGATYVAIYPYDPEKRRFIGNVRGYRHKRWA